ncbi:MAG: transglutaminase domain-containing protein [bacterium]
MSIPMPDALRAALVATATAFVPTPVAAQAPVGAQCNIAKANRDSSFAYDDERFEAIADLPTRFGVGLAKLPHGFVIGDRHADELVLFDERGVRTGTVPYPAYEPAALAFDGKLVVAADGNDGKIYFLDPSSGECVRTIESPMPKVSAMACDAEGKLWIAARDSEVMQRIDPLDGTTLADMKAPSSRVSALTFDPKGYLWAVDSARDRIYLVDVRTGLTIFPLVAPGPVSNGLCLDGGFLYVSDYQKDKLYRTDVSELHGTCVRSDERRGQVTLYCDLQNLGPGEVTGGTMVLAVPEGGPGQVLEKVSWSEGAREETDRWAQHVMVYDAGELDPGQTRSVQLNAVGTFYQVSTKVFPHQVGRLKDIPKEIRERYLADEDKYRVKGEYIQKKAREVVGDEANPYFMARKLYEFLISRINYQMVGGWDIAPTVIERGTGSCSEYTFSYIALCRAVGIPARYVGALVLRGEDASVDTAFHRWAEIYLPSVGWIPVDVNAGDQQWPADRCFSFGGIANRFLITTRGGGASEWLKWGYDLETSYRTRGKANVRTEQFAEWDVVEEERAAAE